VFIGRRCGSPVTASQGTFASAAETVRAATCASMSARSLEPLDRL